MTTSGNSVTAKQPIKIDPNFSLPPNIINTELLNPDNAVRSESRGDDGEVVTVIYDDTTPPDDTGGDDGASDTLSAPVNVTVVEQQVRALSGGSYAVDIIIDVEDVEGADEYEVRLTKI